MTSDSSLRILYLEDEPKDAKLVQASLQAAGIACDFARAETQAQFPEVTLLNSMQDCVEKMASTGGSCFATTSW